MQLTVDREQLIAAITEKRTEIAKRYQTGIDAVQTKLDELTEVDTPAAWLRKIADLVEADDVNVMRGNNGYHSFYLQPVAKMTIAKQTTRRSRADSLGIIPEFPSGHSENREYLEDDLAEAKSDYEAAVGPYDGALQILNMSTDAAVNIVDGDYQGLLSGQTPVKKRSRR